MEVVIVVPLLFILTLNFAPNEIPIPRLVTVVVHTILGGCKYREAVMLVAATNKRGAQSVILIHDPTARRST
jgi:hypothetical protein